MPSVLSEIRLVAVLCSDLHLSLKPPLARSVEEDWLGVQAEYLRQLRDFARPQGLFTDAVPIICAGDVFDRWNSPVELANFALKHLPIMYAIAGQHDLPNHRYEDICRSAYWNLVEAGRIINLYSDQNFVSNNLCLHPFHWNSEVLPCDSPNSMMINVAVIHAYIWTGENSYAYAPESQKLSKWKKRLKGYDVALFGDNHLGFTAKSGECTVFNSGGFMRRKSDEISYRPSVGLLYSNGSVKRKYLDVSKDKFLSETLSEELSKNPHQMAEFLAELVHLGDNQINFREVVKQFLDREEVSPKVRKVILKAMGEET